MKNPFQQKSSNIQLSQNPFNQNNSSNETKTDNFISNIKIEHNQKHLKKKNYVRAIHLS